MTKTINSFVPDQGEVAITISAANVSAIAAFSTAEEIIIDGAVRSFRRTNNPQLAMAETKVTGDTEPIVTVGKTLPAEFWELVLVDDYSEGAAGEWGTDLLSAVEIFIELLAAKQHPGGFQCTPAGGANGDIEYTLTNPKVLSVSGPEINADAERPAERTIIMGSSGHTRATHA